MTQPPTRPDETLFQEGDEVMFRKGQERWRIVWINPDSETATLKPSVYSYPRRYGVPLIRLRLIHRPHPSPIQPPEPPVEEE